MRFSQVTAFAIEGHFKTNQRPEAELPFGFQF